MEKLKLIINAEIELQGKLLFFDKEIRANKIHFFLYTNDCKKVQVNYCKLISNKKSSSEINHSLSSNVFVIDLNSSKFSSLTSASNVFSSSSSFFIEL